jgi:hypothetical protein
MVSGASVTLTKLLWGSVHEKLLVENELSQICADLQPVSVLPGLGVSRGCVFLLANLIHLWSIFMHVGILNPSYPTLCSCRN